jgi:hypothetical protein
MVDGPKFEIRVLMTPFPKIIFATNKNENEIPSHYSYHKVDNGVMKDCIKQEITAAIVSLGTMQISPDHCDKHGGLK